MLGGLAEHTPGGWIMSTAEVIGSVLLASGCVTSQAAEYVWRRVPFSLWVSRCLWLACGLLVSGASLVVTH